MSYKDGDFISDSITGAEVSDSLKIYKNLFYISLVKATPNI